VQAVLSLQVNQARITETLGGLELEPDIGVEWKTPFFLLRWNFAPSLDEPDNLFIDDHSFTFTWRKSY
jgi:hypothetical protein